MKESDLIILKKLVNCSKCGIIYEEKDLQLFKNERYCFFCWVFIINK